MPLLFSGRRGGSLNSSVARSCPIIETPGLRRTTPSRKRRVTPLLGKEGSCFIRYDRV